jgi:UDP-glucose 4-epimerase
VLVLVTGGAGYIGSHVVRALLERGHEPVVLDSLISGRRAAVGPARLIVGDVGDAALLGRLFSDQTYDAVLHFAALKSVEDSVRDPIRYFEHNVARTITLLGAMDRAGVPRFVYSSSAAVYGAPEVLPVTELAPMHPLNPYGESKRLVEVMLAWAHRRGLFQYAALRYFNAAGADEDGSIGEDWSQATNLIPLVLRAALRRGPPVRIFGDDYSTPDGTALRDYVHVTDLATAHVLALDALSEAEAPLVLNLGTEQAASVLEVIDMTRRISGLDVPAERAGRRPGDMPAIWADASLARERLGWQAERTLEDIIRTAWRWHASNAGDSV